MDSLRPLEELFYDLKGDALPIKNVEIRNVTVSDKV